jgi:Arc/MetJ family transcription regulator
MKIEVRKAPPREEGAHQEDTTPEFEAGARRSTHRRTTVTVERETVSFLVRRAVAEAAVAGEAQRAGAEDAPKTPDERLPAATPETAQGGKA